MADGFIELTESKLQTHEGVAELNRMLMKLFENIAGDGETRRIITGQGTPESSVVAGIGSIYMRTDGGASTSIYIKESGSGATGWVAK